MIPAAVSAGPRMSHSSGPTRARRARPFLPRRVRLERQRDGRALGKAGVEAKSDLREEGHGSAIDASAGRPRQVDEVARAACDGVQRKRFHQGSSGSPSRLRPSGSQNTGDVTSAAIVPPGCDANTVVASSARPSFSIASANVRPSAALR